MNAKQFRHFIAAVEAGNLQKASENIHITAPALSISLKNLERDLDVKLLIKDRKGVQMTYAGETFLKGAHSLLKQMDDLQSALLEAEGSPAGSVRLGIPFGASHALAAPLFKILLSKFPGIDLKIEEGNTTSLERLFENNLLDLMINYDVGNKLDRKCEPLYVEHMYMVGPYDPQTAGIDEIESQELGKYPILSSPGTHSLRTMVEKYALDNSINFNYLIDFQSGHASLKIVEEGLAHTIAPWCLIYDHANTDLVSARRIVNPPMERTAYLVTSLNETPSSATRAIIDAVKTSITEAITKDRLRARPFIKPEQAE